MYTLDAKTANAARKADSTGGFIKDIGKYVGVFTQAEDIVAKSGTRGIALNFTANTGQKANLSLYTEKSDGERLMGFDTLMAIMTCLKLRDIKPVQGQVKFWDYDAKAEATRPGKLFPDLQNKAIGLLLETEDYPKNDGGIGTRMVLKSVFQVDTEMTASEILDHKTKPEQLAVQVSGLRHRAIRGARPAAASQPAQRGGGGGTGFDDMDDDIPFAPMGAGRMHAAM